MLYVALCVKFETIQQNKDIEILSKAFVMPIDSR